MTPDHFIDRRWLVLSDDASGMGDIVFRDCKTQKWADELARRRTKAGIPSRVIVSPFYPPRTLMSVPASWEQAS